MKTYFAHRLSGRRTSMVLLIAPSALNLYDGMLNDPLTWLKGWRNLDYVEGFPELSRVFLPLASSSWSHTLT